MIALLDACVLYSAVQSHAKIIVTFNLKDFPGQTLEPLGLKAVHPDDFLLNAIERDWKTVQIALQKQRHALRNPPMTPLEFIEQFQKHGVPRTSQRLHSLLEHDQIEL